MKIKADIVVVGSGAGGATVGMELAKKGRDVLVIERGPYVKEIGTQRAGLAFYDKCGLRTSKEGVIVYRTIMVGGTTVASCGNGIIILEKELKDLGIDISAEAQEALREMWVAPLADRLIGKGSRLIMDIGNRMGLEFFPMPKYVDPKKCTSCGLCVVGCKTGAKWSAVNYVEIMKKHGGKLITGLDVKSVAIHKGRAIGLVARQGREEIRIYANKIVLAAGGFGSPVILKRSGIEEAGNQFFVDLLNVTYGVIADETINQSREPTMAVVSVKFLESKGFLLSPFIDVPIVLRWTMPAGRHLKGYKHRNLLGVMTKIKDESKGTVMANEKFFKVPTEKDYEKLNEGARISREILLEAGVKNSDIFTSKPRGAHPGGTAAIGTVVDNRLRTRFENLYVCDASVLPVASGAPPIVTIVALAKRLSKSL